MEMASATFWKLLEDGRFHHDGDPTLRAHVMGATTKQTGKGWRFDPDGDHAAADSTRSRTSLGTCRSVYPRTVRRLATAS